jgi:hypothetical protein
MSIDHIPYTSYVSAQANYAPVSAAPSSSTAKTAITIHPNSGGASSAADPTNAAASAAGDKPYWSGSGGPTFGDLLDIINPLQHIPVVSDIYQKITGDTSSSGANIFGGLLFGGGIGLVASVANEIVQQVSGKTLGGNLIAAVTGETSTTTAANDAAQKTTATAPTVATPSAAPAQIAAAAPPGIASPPASAANAAQTALLQHTRASAAYQNAQEAVLDIFEPTALQKTETLRP